MEAFKPIPHFDSYVSPSSLLFSMLNEVRTLGISCSPIPHPLSKIHLISSCIGF